MVSDLLKQYFLDYESHAPTTTPLTEKIAILEEYIKKSKIKQRKPESQSINISTAGIV